MLAVWLIADNLVGPDKVLHFLVSALGTWLLTAVMRWAPAKALVTMFGIGVALELVQGIGGSLGWSLPPPIGGDAELADLVADACGAVLGVAVATVGHWALRCGRRDEQRRRWRRQVHQP